MSPDTCTIQSDSLPSRRIITALVVALLLGLVAREVAYRCTSSIRYELNQRNAFYWGDRIVSGAAAHGGFWQSYLAVYDENAAHPAPLLNTLDYVPLRLLMAGAWVEYVNYAYGPQTEWRPEFARSFAAFSMLMELAGAAVMFALVARWLKRDGSPGAVDLRWRRAAAAAILFWLNPASIIDSHVWPHGQTWVLPFYLGAVLALFENRAFLAGAIYGVGIMFKGQMLLIAPTLLLWRLFDRRPSAALKVALGMCCGVGLIVWPWMTRGSFAWLHAGFGANGIYSDVLRKGTALNFPALLEKVRGAQLHEHIVNLVILGHRVTLELRMLLIVIYASVLVLCSRGIAEQARNGDRRLLVSIAAPWAAMFFFLGQMDERYMVWSACLTAGAAALVSDRHRSLVTLACHVLLTWAAATTMIEFLLIAEPQVAAAAVRLLVKLNPVTWLLTAVAVSTLVIQSWSIAPGSQGIASRYNLQFGLWPRRIEA